MVRQVVVVHKKTTTTDTSLLLMINLQSRHSACLLPPRIVISLVTLEGLNYSRFDYIDDSDDD